MRIPSGDLAPARRHRRRRGWLPVLLALVLVGALGGGAYVLRKDDGVETVAQDEPCVSPTASATPPVAVALPAPRTVRLRLLNGTFRDGLARAVGTELRRRGFVVTVMTNAPKALPGQSLVTYGPGGRPAATLVAAHTIGATLLPVPSAARGSVDLTLGSTFVRLRRGPEVAAFLTPSPAPSRTCP